jgi:putative oxidoreductase
MTNPAPNKRLHIALWVVQILLAGSFLLGGVFRGFAPMEMLAEKIPWVPGVPAWVTRLSGISEVFGALGLILPSATRIKPTLTPIASYCLIFVMVLAAGLHVSRGEYPFIIVNVVYVALLGFVAWGRLKKAPITPR